MEQDFFFEESSPLKSILIFVLLGILAVVFGIFFFMTSDKDDLKLKEVTYELGDKLSHDVKKYGSGSKINLYEIDLSRVNVDEDGKLNSVGEYLFYLKQGTESHKGKINVVDTIAPKVEVKELTVGVDEEYELEDFIVSCEDLSEECHVYYDDINDENVHKEEGTYNFKIVITDASKNETKEKVTLHVKKGYSLQREKAKDDEPFLVYPENVEWNQTYTVKFPLALSEDDEKFDKTILEFTNKNYQEDYDENIIDKKLITIYNKYNLVIGISVKLEFKDKVVFVGGANEE